MMRVLFLVLLALPFRCFATPCPVTVGTLTLVCTSPRTTGISPLLVFVDCSKSSDTGLTNATAYPTIPSNTDNPFQHVYYTYNFGDTNPSGTGTWTYGANPGANSKNLATGPIAAHAYITNSDATYTIKVDAYSKSGNTASCTLPVTAYSQTGTNGFSAANTTCVSPSGNFTGCPAGATQLTTSSIATATAAAHWASGKLLLLHCGENLTTGSMVSTAVTKARLDVYPFDSTCRDQATGRPQLTSGGQFLVRSQSVDVAISNVDAEGSGTSAGRAYSVGEDNYPPSETQVTLYNVKAAGYLTSYALAFCNQCGMVQAYQAGMGPNSGNQGAWPELVGNGCINGNTTYDCGGANTPLFQDCTNGVEDTLGTPLYYVPGYIAVIGSFYSGAGTGHAGGNGIETFRIPGGHCYFIANSTFTHANDVGAVMKAQCSGAHNTQTATSGSVCSVWVFEDNLFSGPAGGQTVELSPQNSVTDERIALGDFERNLLQPASGSGGPAMLISGRFISVRNNVCDNSAAGGSCFQICRRGIEWVNNGTTYTDAPDYIEFLNNTTVSGAITLASGGPCQGAHSQAVNHSVFENSLHYQGGGTGTGGTGNVVSNNTTTTSNNPGFTNSSGHFSTNRDYEPTANFSGADATVPNFFDVCGYAWASQYTLGALSQVCP